MPRFLLPGDCCPSLLATEAFLPFLSGVSVSVSGHIWGWIESVNAFLQFYFNWSAARRNPRVSRQIRALGPPNRYIFR
jgi:hypothetical protein